MQAQDFPERLRARPGAVPIHDLQCDGEQPGVEPIIQSLRNPAPAGK